MTVDELVELTEALFFEMEIDSKSFRTSADQLSTLSDDAFVVAVRFLSGERPVHSTMGAYREARNPVPMSDEHEDEQIVRLAQEMADEAPAAVKDLGDGVTLGLE